MLKTAVVSAKSITFVGTFRNLYLISSMNIGVDGSYAILKNNTTEGNYSKIVVDAIAECYSRHKIYAYTPWVDRRGPATTLAALPNVSVKQPRNALSKTLWMNWSGVVSDMSRHRVNIYHGLAGRLPMRIGRSHAKAVVTIHGLAFKHYPGDYSLSDRIKRGWAMASACRHADAIVATSQHTRDDLVSLMGVDADKIHVVYPAVDRRFLGRIVPAEFDAVRNKYKLPSRYVLVVSSLLEHKNIQAVLQAMKQMQDHDFNLVLVGNATNYYTNVLRPLAKRNHLMHRVLHISRAHAMDMPSIYRMADALVAPSRCEGFGLTVIEAQACGVPVITTSDTALEEAAGSAALFFAPDDIDTLASHLDRVLSDESLRQQLIGGGRQNIERFTYQTLADNLDTLYHSLLER